MSYITVPLEASHKKEDFSCGKPMLDTYLHRQAKQDVKRRLSACFVLAVGSEIIGYYTLSTASVERRLLPAEIVKKLPPAYSELPATLLGRLTVDQNYQGQGSGEMILMDALKRSYFASMLVGSMAVVADPLEEGAIKFYKKYGFILLPDSRKMFLAMETIARLFPGD
jgi:ribosomal protein S18 acetylase RimI-like enzyme